MRLAILDASLRVLEKVMRKKKIRQIKRTNRKRLDDIFKQTEGCVYTKMSILMVYTQISYHERTCSLCNVHDVQDEYHIAMICEYFQEVREKYVKQYYWT